MFYKDVINLISVSRERNANGYPEETETVTQVYANVKSVTRSEFYDALRAGITQAIAFEVFAPDYSNQKYVDYNGTRYKVERCYIKNEVAELNCSEALNYGNSE